MDGSAIGAGYRSADLPKALRDAAAGSHQLGLTVQIAAATLEITVRVRDPKTAETIVSRTAWPLTAGVRARLLVRPLAVLSRDGRHGVTPYFDDGRRLGA